MSTAPTPAHRRRAPGRLKLTLAAIAVFLLAAILAVVVVDRVFFSSSSSRAGTGSGVASTQARPLPPFTGVELASDNNVIVQVGATQSVTVHADSNLLTRVTTRVRSGRLVIGTTPGNLSAKTPMFVAVSLPSLDRLRLQADGNIAVTRINSRTLTVALAEAATSTRREPRRSSTSRSAARERPCCASSSRATRKLRSVAKAASCSPRRTVSPRRSQAAARSSMAAIPARHPEGHPERDDQRWISAQARDGLPASRQLRVSFRCDRAARLLVRGASRVGRAAPSRLADPYRTLAATPSTRDGAGVETSQDSRPGSPNRSHRSRGCVVVRCQGECRSGCRGRPMERWSRP